ncbi:MAG: S1C family serine protease [Chloroflexi bacterium]|nr:S1C family serine protease [Chloroflexota bacterium]
MSNMMMELSQAMAEAVATAGPGVVQVAGRRRLPATGMVWAADGLIVTANHVVRRDENIQIRLADGSSVNAVLVGRDPSTDTAVLRAEAADFDAVGGSQQAGISGGQSGIGVGTTGPNGAGNVGYYQCPGWQLAHRYERTC